MNDLTINNSMISPSPASSAGQQTPRPGTASFGQMLEGALGQVNQLQNEAESSINNLANGTQTDIHQTMIAVEKAEVSFELLMQIRNKLIAAYENIMRMPV
jgi:flagellar hook-basal body complex protein FliE